MSEYATDVRLSEWRERIGERVMNAMACTHEGDDFGPGAVCRTCFANAQSIGALIESEVCDWSTHALATGAGAASRTAPGHATEAEALAEAIWNASRADEGTISATGANHVAAALLASDWMQQHDDAVRAEALEQAADDLADRLDTFPQEGRHTRARWAELFLRDRAARLRVGGDES